MNQPGVVPLREDQKDELEAAEARARSAANRGTQARLLLQNELLLEAFEALKARYLREISDSKLTEKDRREAAYLALKVLELVEEHLKSIVNSGKIADKDIEKITHLLTPAQESVGSRFKEELGKRFGYTRED